MSLRSQQDLTEILGILPSQKVVQILAEFSQRDLCQNFAGDVQHYIQGI